MFTLLRTGLPQQWPVTWTFPSIPWMSRNACWIWRAVRAEYLCVLCKACIYGTEIDGPWLGWCCFSQWNVRGALGFRVNRNSTFLVLGIRLWTFQYQFNPGPIKNSGIWFRDDEQCTVLLTNVWNFVLRVKPCAVVTVTGITEVCIKSSENK